MTSNVSNVLLRRINAQLDRHSNQSGALVDKISSAESDAWEKSRRIILLRSVVASVKAILTLYLSMVLVMTAWVALQHRQPNHQIHLLHLLNLIV